MQRASQVTNRAPLSVADQFNLTMPARVVELDPIYCDRILTRYERLAKDEAEQLVCGWPRADVGTGVLEAAE